MAGPLVEYPISLDSKRHIAHSLWGSPDCDDLQAYFRYYTLQCAQIIQACESPSFPLTCHQDVLDIASDIRARFPHTDIKQRLSTRRRQQQQQVSDDHLSNAISLVVRLLLMLDVGEFQNAYTGRARFVWSSGTIDDFLGSLPVFSKAATHCHDSGKFGSVFNARNLDRIAGIKVKLTTNLADHLLFREGEVKTVNVFHHASFLRRQEHINSVFPPEFIAETLQTLALLFPKGDMTVEKWYRRLGESDELDLKVLRCGAADRRIENYVYWQDRLIRLKDAFDEARPATLAQWWNDRRDGVQWYTLWLAIAFTVFFGLIQSVEGAIQVYKAFHPAEA